MKIKSIQAYPLAYPEPHYKRFRDLEAFQLQIIGEFNDL